jgi:hypothetical protein
MRAIETCVLCGPGMEGFGAIDAPDERRERLATLGGLFHGPSSGLVYVLTLALMPREDRSDFPCRFIRISEVGCECLIARFTNPNCSRGVAFLGSADYVSA